ncbi:MAG: hypothetical protein ONA90_05840, partial [candidate division KSB1 bacterium]|nr:hypothetical protein [candidate division KSB1 bacterium]
CFFDKDSTSKRLKRSKYRYSASQVLINKFSIPLPIEALQKSKGFHREDAKDAKSFTVLLSLRAVPPLRFFFLLRLIA